MKSTFASRGDELPLDLVHHFESMDTSVLKLGWKSALSSVADAPSFEASMDAAMKLVERLMRLSHTIPK